MKLIKSQVLSNPAMEDKISPGARSSSSALNRLLEDAASDVNALRERYERFMEERNILDQAIAAHYNITTNAINALSGMIRSVWSNSPNPYMDFHWSSKWSGWFTLDATNADHNSLYGQITLPVERYRSIIRSADGKPNRNLSVRLGYAASANWNPDDNTIQFESWPSVVEARSNWENAVDANSLTPWLVSVPTSINTVLVQIDLPAMTSDMVANGVSFTMFPAGNMDLTRLYVRTLSRGWQSVSLSILPRYDGSAARGVSAGRVWWDPEQYGAINAVRFLFYPNSSTNRIFGMLDLDVFSVRFAKSGSFSLNLSSTFTGKTAASASLFGSDTGYCSYTLGYGPSVTVTMNKVSAYVSPVLTGIRVTVQ